MDPIQLLTSDAENLVLGALLEPTWGVYLNGQPVIQPASILGSIATASLAPIQALAGLLGFPNILPVMASTVDFEYAQDWPISTFPQEQGAFQAYDKVTLPYDVRLRVASGTSDSNRQAFLSTILAIGNSFALFDVVTPEMVFTSVNCTHVYFKRTATQGAKLIQVDLWFKNIPVTAGASFTNTQTPQDSGPQALGTVQTQTPNQQVQQSFQSLSVM
jgi:hypothetical protein